MKKDKLLILALTLMVATTPMMVLAQEVVSAPQAIINAIMSVTAFAMNILILVGVLFLVLAGFQFVFARGEESKLSTARSMMLWSLIGIAAGAIGPKLVEYAAGIIGVWWK